MPRKLSLGTLNQDELSALMNGAPVVPKHEKRSMSHLQLTPNKWVTEDLLIATTGLRPGTIKRAREKAWLQGKEYLLFSPEGEPKPNSECMYNRQAIDEWIEKQAMNQPDAVNRKKA